MCNCFLQNKKTVPSGSTSVENSHSDEAPISGKPHAKSRNAGCNAVNKAGCNAAKIQEF